MKDKKIGLFMLSPLTQGGGAEKYFINLARDLGAEEGIEADVITFNDESFRGFARLLHIFFRGNFFAKIEDYEKGMREKREDIERELGEARWIESPRKKLGTILINYDIIYAKNEIADLLLLKMIGYKRLPPIVVGVHTPIIYPERNSFIAKLHNFIYASFFYKWLIGSAGCIHVSNSATENFIDKKFHLKSELIYYPFSVRKNNELARKNRSHITFDGGKKNIIFAGRLAEQKGIDRLLGIIEKIGQDDELTREISLNIFGSGDQKHETRLRDMAVKFSFVRYFGHIENKFMPDILSQQDLMLAPSRWETLPYSVLEAQAVGLPVIAFDIPGPNDIIKTGKTGFLVKSESEYFRRIMNFVKGEVSFKKEEIIENIENKFEPKKIRNKMINMFERNICQN